MILSGLNVVNLTRVVFSPSSFVRLPSHFNTPSSLFFFVSFLSSSQPRTGKAEWIVSDYVTYGGVVLNAAFTAAYDSLFLQDAALSPFTVVRRSINSCHLKLLSLFIFLAFIIWQ